MNTLTLKILFLAGIFSLPCTTKVSEWVLLNAEPNQYSLVYVHNALLTEPVKKQNAGITRNISSANISFRSLENKDIPQPYYALYYGRRLFSKYSDPGQLKGLTTSPLREKIASEIMAGKLCVLLYLATDDAAKDEKGLRAIREALKTSPFGEVITVVELSRKNSAESQFVTMLLNVEDDLKTIQEPMLFGVFGRFKALEPLVGKGITEENIKLMIDFLTADCSCLIKDNLPGTDILFTNKWASPATALVNRILDENPSLQHF